MRHDESPKRASPPGSPSVLIGLFGPFLNSGAARPANVVTGPRRRRFLRRQTGHTRHAIIGAVRGCGLKRRLWQNATDHTPLDAALARLATDQHGVVTLGQLKGLGLSPSAVRMRASAGRAPSTPPRRLRRGTSLIASEGTVARRSSGLWERRRAFTSLCGSAIGNSSQRPLENRCHHPAPSRPHTLRDPCSLGPPS